MEHRRESAFKILLSLGFALVALSVLLAYTNPVRGYEYSIYTQTPPAVWVALGIAFVVAGVVMFSTELDRVRYAGVFLSGTAMLTVVSLPVLRGYYYKGEGDALSHLGRTMDLMAGNVDGNEFVYPAVHLFGTVTVFVTNMPLNTVLLVTVIVFLSMFFVFVPLTVRAIATERSVVLFGVFAGFLLLPVNHNSGGLFVHPTSQAHMFAPFVLFSLIVFYMRRSVRTFVLFLVSFGTLIILHPQQAANLLIVLSSLVVIHYLFQYWPRLKGIVTGPNVVYTFGLATAIFWVWIYRLGRFESHLAGRVERIFMDTEVGRPTAARASSLEAIGGSVPEVFFKLFFVPSLFSIVTAALSLVVVIALLSPEWERSVPNPFSDCSRREKHIIGVLSASIVPLFMLFLIYLQHGTGSDQYFRHHAFIMVLVTIVGAVGLGKLILGLGVGKARTRDAFVVLSVVLLALTLLVVFPSPYFYQSSSHVTEVQVAGFDTAYEYDDDSITYDRLRSNPSRYADVREGEPETRNLLSGVPSHFADQDIRNEYAEQTYVPITESSRIQDTIVWEGLRFEADDYRYIDTTDGSNRVVSNGGVTLYLIDPGSDDS
jgi:hypothetical protein